MLTASFPKDANASCATPGRDGSATIGGVINSYFPATASVIVGQTSIPIGTGTGAGVAIAAGDLLLVIQMQDANINNANTNAYGANNGTGSGSNGLRSSGLYEYVRATGVTAAGSVPIFGTGPGTGLNNAYAFGGNNASLCLARYEN